MSDNPEFKDTLMEALGIKILPQKNNKYYASMPVDHRTKQIHGALHGGASIALAETLAGYASTQLCKDGEIALGLSVNANHIATTNSGTVTAEATAIKLGKRTHLWQIDITDENGSLLSSVRITNYLITKNK